MLTIDKELEVLTKDRQHLSNMLGGAVIMSKYKSSAYSDDIEYCEMIEKSKASLLEALRVIDARIIFLKEKLQ